MHPPITMFIIFFTVLKTKMLQDLGERNFCTVIPKLIPKEQKEDDLYSHDTSKLSNVSSEFNKSLLFTDEEIKEIIGA